MKKKKMKKKFLKKCLILLHERNFGMCIIFNPVL